MGDSMYLFNQVRAQASKYEREEREWRPGQRAWNALAFHEPDGVLYECARTMIHMTRADPFHDDSRLDLFWHVIEELTLLSSEINSLPTHMEDLQP